MNAAEVCIDAPRSAVDAVLAPLVLSSEVDGDVTRLELPNGAVGTVVDDEQDSYAVSIFVRDGYDSGAARSLYASLAETTSWSMELRDEDSGETLLRTRPRPRYRR